MRGRSRASRTPDGSIGWTSASCIPWGSHTRPPAGRCSQHWQSCSLTYTYGRRSWLRGARRDAPVPAAVAHTQRRVRSRRLRPAKPRSCRLVLVQPRRPLAPLLNVCTGLRAIPCWSPRSRARAVRRHHWRAAPGRQRGESDSAGTQSLDEPPERQRCSPTMYPSGLGQARRRGWNRRPSLLPAARDGAVVAMARTSSIYARSALCDHPSRPPYAA